MAPPDGATTILVMGLLGLVVCGVFAPVAWIMGNGYLARCRRMHAEPESTAVRAAVGRLRAGRWWPDLPAILDGLSHELPDGVMVGEEGPTGDRP